MPFEIISLGRGKYEVKNSETGTIHSKHTTKKNAQAQLRILNQVSKGEGVEIKKDIKAKLEEAARHSQENFIKNEQERTKPKINLTHLVIPPKIEAKGVKPKPVDLTHLVYGIGDKHIARMGL